MRFGWTWDELMATPAPIVEAAVGLLNAAAQAASEPQGQPWPGRDWPPLQGAEGD